MLALACLVAALAPAQAQTQNYFGTSGTLSGAVWSTNPGGPYTSALNTTGGAVINFDNPTTAVTGASITVAGINATANATLTSTGGTISNFGAGIVPISVNGGVTLDFSNQAFTSAMGAGYRKEGDGVLAIAGGTYRGGFTLNAGTVVARGVNAFGAGGMLTINGGTIAANQNRDFLDKYPNGIVVGGDFTLGATSGLASATANLTFTNQVALGGATRKIVIGGNGTYTLGGSITGTAGLTVDATASGTLVLSGANSYLGPTTLQGGATRFTTPAALYNGNPENWVPANLIVHPQAAAIFQAGGAGEFGALQIAAVLAGTAFQTGASFSLDTTNAISGKFVQDAPLAEPPEQTVNLVKEGSGTLALSAANAYSGQTIVRSGTLQIGDSGTQGDLGASPGVTNNATLRIQRGDDFTLPQPIAGTGSVLHSGSGNTTLTANHTYTGFTTVTAGSLAFGGNASLANGASLLVSGNSGATFKAETTSSLVFNTGITIGNTGQSGAVRHSSGSLSVINTTNYLTVGAGGHGAYLLEGGQLSTAGSTGIRIGATNATGQGTFLQTGGALESSRAFAIGHSGGTGVATFTGGTFNTSTGYGILLGETGSGSGTLNLGTQAGGDATIISQATSFNPGITIGSGAAGVLNLNSGTLRITASAIRKGSASAALHLNGGTIQAGAPFLSVIENTVPATVFRGGAVFDTQSHTTIVAAQLAAGSGQGVYPAGGGFSISAGSGYAGAPLVTVTGGSGSGASAIAEITNGVVTAVKITSPGQNYAAGDTLDFQFGAAGAAVPAPAYSHVLTAADLAAHASGGLTKRGTGTLHLSGASSYTGETVVQAGTLLVSGSLSGSTARVKSGTTLAGSGTIHGAVIEDGAHLTPGNGPGTLTVVSTLVLDPTAAVTFQLSGANQTPGAGVNDLVIAGSLRLDGTLNITEIGAGTFTNAPLGSRWRLFDFAPGELEDAGMELGAVPNLAPTFYLTLDTSIAGKVDLVLVPEPAAWAALLVGAAPLLARRRRRVPQPG